ncbi:MAG: tRNA pseudouridine synthase D [Porticoccaceae bacterium]|nr:tRNA pseudouridine synthase D [Porticoccaceae bacterium]
MPCCGSSRTLIVNYINLRNTARTLSDFNFQCLPKFLPCLGKARMKASMMDFCVDEILGFEFSGSGEHLIVNIRKYGQNSRWIAARLAELSGIEEKHVGYCGLKDRFAVTSQWYSLYLPNRCLNIADLSHPDFEVLSLKRHSKKLRRGMHAGNSFKILITDISAPQGKLEQRLKMINRFGFPNYFAQQRFGFNGGNLLEAERLINSARLRGNSKGQGLFLSAARSWLFNLVLARHITNYHDGVVFPLDETGPLWGRGRSKPNQGVALVEREALIDWPGWKNALEHTGLTQDRRKLFMHADGLKFNFLDSCQLKLEFNLPKGVYATALLRELVEFNR